MKCGIKKTNKLIIYTFVIVSEILLTEFNRTSIEIKQCKRDEILFRNYQPVNWAGTFNLLSCYQL